MSVYALGIPVGLALGVLFGAAIAEAVNWRTAFVVVGIAGIVIAPVFRLVVKEPPKPAQAAARVPVGTVFSTLARKRSFWLMALAAAASSTCGYGLAFWSPSILIAQFGFDLPTTSWFYGSLLLVGGVIGVYSGGVLADRLGRSDRGAYAWVSGIAWISTAPFFVAAFLSPSPVWAWGLLVVPNALNILFVGPLTTAAQHLVPAQMRATASACFLLINNLIGIGAGSLLLGAVSDVMTPRFGDMALQYSAIGLCGLYVVAAVLGFMAAKPLRQDWVDDTPS
jgi:predicted MFS family arabinose efflux permease